MNIEFKYNPFKQYPWRWYYSPQGEEFAEVMLWLYDTYGSPIRNSRWDINRGWISFADKKDADWFILRWSS
jgi:hypothetical protein